MNLFKLVLKEKQKDTCSDLHSPDFWVTKEKILIFKNLKKAKKVQKDYEDFIETKQNQKCKYCTNTFHTVFYQWETILSQVDVKENDYIEYVNVFGDLG